MLICILLESSFHESYGFFHVFKYSINNTYQNRTPKPHKIQPRRSWRDDVSNCIREGSNNCHNYQTLHTKISQFLRFNFQIRSKILPLCQQSCKCRFYRCRLYLVPNYYLWTTRTTCLVLNTWLKKKWFSRLKNDDVWNIMNWFKTKVLLLLFRIERYLWSTCCKRKNYNIFPITAWFKLFSHNPYES